MIMGIKTYGIWKKRLFSTKFLEDLEYKPGLRNQHHHHQQKQQQQAKKKKPPPPPTTPKKQPPKNEALALDIAESIYHREVELLIRQLAESTFKEEARERLRYQKPIYESIYEPMVSKMIREIAREVIDDYERKIRILESHEVKKVARDKIVNNLMLDHMLDSVAQQNKQQTAAGEDGNQVNELLDSNQPIRII